MLEQAPRTRASSPALTPRERDVLRNVAEGLTNPQVAQRLDVTVHAVKFHLTSIYRKLGVANRTEAAVAFERLEGPSPGRDTDTELPRGEWNATEAAYPAAACLHDLVSEVAASRSDDVAVSDADGDLRYGELDLQSNQLANHLRALGVERGSLVGISVTRSTETLIGLLGILKAGAAYVPIDPTYPDARQSFMLEHSGAAVVVTEQSVAAKLPASGQQLVLLDSDARQISKRSTDPPRVELNPEDLAYVIYTSGSTGTPKGVEIPHRALVNFLYTMRERPGLNDADVLLAVTTLSFDIAGLELYLPLVTGARVVIAAQEASTDPRALLELMDQFGVTVMQATPTTWRMLINAGWRGRTGLKVLCGGEALPVALADELVERDVELWNMYGPTETTIWSTVAPITTRGEPLTIGRPIGNTTLHILDEALKHVHVGEVGELHIGGDGLARGYRDRPDLTAERFIPDPFAESPGGRLYKTGDLARYRPDGNVEYLGRIDDQVKVRGFRIELGEIETVLSRHDAVSAAVATVREDEPGDPRLVAYVISADGTIPSSELRAFAARTLPAYMVPSAVVTLDAFPLTPNGKVDRRALPAPSFERGESEYVEARTDLERELVRIWEEELDVRPIGVMDDFFDLGATSYVAAKLFARIERDLGHKLPLAPVFQAPTVAQLAELIDDGGGSSRWTSLVPIQPKGSNAPIFCVHGGAGTVLHLQPLARSLGNDQPFYGLQARGLYGDHPPLLWVEDMAAHYLTELKSVQPKGPYYLAGYCFGTIVAFEMAQSLLRTGEEVELLAMFNGPSPLWIRIYGSPEGQPGRLDQRRPTSQSMPRNVAADVPLPSKVLRVLRDPQRLRHWIGYARFRLRRTRERGFDYVDAKTRMVLGRPLSERLRGRYFLRIAAVAERVYEPSVYPGEILLFHGDGLYDDPELGWTGLAARGIRSIAVPGAESDNRELMNEPHVGVVGDHLQTYLSESRSRMEGAGASG